MGKMGHLIGAERAAAAGVLGPAEYAGLEEGTIDDRLSAVLAQGVQANCAFWPLEFVRFLYRHPRHPAAFGSERVAGPRQSLFLHEHLLARGLPGFGRNDRRRLDS